MLIDCDRCVMRDLACSDCVVTVLLGPPPESGFDEEERRALGLADEQVQPAASVEGEAPYLSTVLVPARRTTRGGKL